jgi:hypothetical protein
MFQSVFTVVCLLDKLHFFPLDLENLDRLDYLSTTYFIATLGYPTHYKLNLFVNTPVYLAVEYLRAQVALTNSVSTVEPTVILFRLGAFCLMVILVSYRSELQLTLVTLKS